MLLGQVDPGTAKLQCSRVEYIYVEASKDMVECSRVKYSEVELSRAMVEI